MRVFYTLAQHLEERGTRRAAFVIAEDPGEALLLLRKSVHFSGFALPPIELTEHGEGASAIRRQLGDGHPSEKGVFPVMAGEPVVG
jgi:hypothetical protein